MTRAILAVLLVTAVASAKPPVGARAIVDRPVAIVGGEPIWKSEIDDTLRAAKAEPSPDVFQKVLDELIETHLMLQAADAAHVTATDAEIDAGIQQIEQQNHLDDAALDTALAEHGYTRAAYRAELGREIRIQKLLQQELVPRIQVRASDSPDEFQRALEIERRAWIERRKQAVHVERRQ
jgi:parvulin-like peptidyl-prolyl isomerase